MAVVKFQRQDLIDYLVSQFGGTKKDAAESIEFFTNGLQNFLLKKAKECPDGLEMTIVGFGKFKVIPTEEREGRNPQTGESTTIEAGRRASFSFAKPYRQQISEVK